MPLYEYECRDCREVIEKIQKFSDRPLTKCPKCGGKLKRLLSPPAIQFKGSGWYVTDYAGKSASETGKPAGGSDGQEKKAEEKKPSETRDKAPEKTESSAVKAGPAKPAAKK